MPSGTLQRCPFLCRCSPSSPIVEASKSLDTVKNFLRVHELGFAITAATENGGTRVLWSDIRYCWSGIRDCVRCGSAGPSTAKGGLSCRLFTWDSGCRVGLSRREAEKVIGKGSARACGCALHVEPVS